MCKALLAALSPLRRRRCRAEPEDSGAARRGGSGEFIELLSHGACFGVEVLNPHGDRA
ncbi:hypothetical protein BZL29_8195 [Mycobacterium kansasii]|uniref:Uncharacterized protein n=1 Tax=Mycobacterium kansasii TaxID=1768 RepID=A0A1V3WBU2_MYCKA|nr:hypothetical protein BZL29_8195 [Mycobacterium kansasii]